MKLGDKWSVFKSFEEFCCRVRLLKLGDKWSVEASSLFVKIFIGLPEFKLANYEIYVEPSLRFYVRVFGWIIQEDHFFVCYT